MDDGQWTMDDGAIIGGGGYDVKRIAGSAEIDQGAASHGTLPLGLIRSDVPLVQDPLARLAQGGEQVWHFGRPPQTGRGTAAHTASAEAGAEIAREGAA